MNRLVESGYAYEIAGLVFYVFFLSMVRSRDRARYSQRTRILTIVTAIALVGVVPFHYGASALAIGVLLALGIAAIGSAFADRRAAR